MADAARGDADAGDAADALEDFAQDLADEAIDAIRPRIGPLVRDEIRPRLAALVRDDLGPAMRREVPALVSTATAELDQRVPALVDQVRGEIAARLTIPTRYKVGAVLVIGAVLISAVASTLAWRATRRR